MSNLTSNSPILVTGGTGFVGSHLVELLLSQGQTNIHVTTYQPKNGFVEQLLPSENVHGLNLLDESAVSALIAQLKPIQIYHFAATAQVGSSFDTAKQTLNNNLNLQMNLLNAVQKHAPNAKILIVGSGTEYDPNLALGPTLTETDQLGPANPYAVSKVMQDLLAYSYFKAFNLQLVRVRPFNHIGERQTLGFVISDFAEQIVKIERGQQTEIRVGNLEAVRDFSDVKDMVKAYPLLLEKGVIGDVYNLGSGQGISIQAVLDKLIALAQVPIKVDVDQSKMRPADVKVAIANIDKIRALGWQPTTPLDETLERILSWWRQQETLS